MPPDKTPRSSDRELAELEPIDRLETGVRALKTLLFYVVTQVIQFVLVVVVLFDLLYALVAGQDPSRGLRSFSQRVIDYWVEIARYLTYLDDDAPFPFRDFPPERALWAADWEPAPDKDEESEESSQEQP